MGRFWKVVSIRAASGWPKLACSGFSGCIIAVPKTLPKNPSQDCLLLLRRHASQVVDFTLAVMLPCLTHPGPVGTHLASKLQGWIPGFAEDGSNTVEGLLEGRVVHDKQVGQAVLFSMRGKHPPEAGALAGRDLGAGTRLARGGI